MVARSGSRGKVIVAGVAGVLVGVAGSFAGGYVWADRNAEVSRNRPASDPTPAVSAAHTTRIVVERGTTAVNEQRLAAMERRLAELTAPAPTGFERAPSPEQAQQRYEARVRQHASEAVDPAWSRSTAALIEADVLKQASSLNVRLGRVDCRTASCTAELEWPSMAEADREYQSLVHFPYRANCSRTVLLPPPSAAGAAVRAQMFLDCESWRAEGADPLEAAQAASAL